MKPSDDKIDASMQAYARRWMKSLDRPRPSTTLGYFFVGLFILFWSSSLTELTGLDLRKFLGVLVFLGFALILTLLTLLIVWIMTRLGLDRPTRSAFLLSAVVGPYVNMVAEQTWKMSVVSHVLGFLGAILAFLASLSLDKLLAKSAHKPGEE
jgi:hypothetical protein